MYTDQVRGKAKKLAGSAKNAPRKLNQKHRGLKKNEGHYVSENTILALQFNQLPFHPGLNVRIIGKFIEKRLCLKP